MVVPTERQRRTYNAQGKLKRRGFQVVVRDDRREGPIFGVRGNGVCRNNMNLDEVDEFLAQWDASLRDHQARTPKPKCSDEPCEDIRIAVDR